MARRRQPGRHTFLFLIGSVLELCSVIGLQTRVEGHIWSVEYHTS